jgi:hypothetical protein
MGRGLNDVNQEAYFLLEKFEIHSFRVTLILPAQPQQDNY